jgi:hypothetical protein
MPPINLQDKSGKVIGTDAFDYEIAVYRPDLIIFDNIQALLVGDMTKEDAWALTKAGLGLRFNEHIWKATARPCSRTLAVSASKASSPSARAQAIAPAARPIG